MKEQRPRGHREKRSGPSFGPPPAPAETEKRHGEGKKYDRPMRKGQAPRIDD